MGSSYSDPSINGLHHGSQKAYEQRDTEASRLVYDMKNSEAHDSVYGEGGEYLKTMTFGGLDGILTSFAIVAGSAGGGLDWTVVLMLGFSNILADALSMGAGECLSSMAHNEYVVAEKRREEWELRNHREEEILEMIQIFHSRGMTIEDAEDVVHKMAKYDDFFINLMMTEELGLQVPEAQEDIYKEGMVMFFSFAFFGSLPLIGYTVFPTVKPDISNEALFFIACVVTTSSLFFLGAMKSKFSTRSWYSCGLEMVCLGSACAAVAYEVGNLMSSLLE